MSLRTILNRLASDAGFDITNQRDYVVDNINAFARDLHDAENLTWCDREQIFILDHTKQRVALPWQVMVFHAARDADFNNAISTVGLGPRYKRGTWRSIIDQWRVIRRSPIKRDVLSGGKVYVHLDEASEEQIVVTVVGSTPSASRKAETIVVPAGEVLVESENIFESFENIEKSDVSDVDLMLSTSNNPDDTSSIIAEIPNHQTQANYLLIQHSDFYAERNQDICVEMWYKHRYVPMLDDYDVFVCTEVYDNALYLGAWGRLLAKTQDKVEAGLAMMEKATMLARTISAREAESQDEEIPLPFNVVDRMSEWPWTYLTRWEEVPFRR